MEQIFQQLIPPDHQTVLMFTSPVTSLGVVANMIAVNHGNVLVNQGVQSADYGNDSDYVRVAIGNSVVINETNYIAYDTFLPPGHMTQWQALSLQAGETVFVYSEKGQTSFTLMGTTYDV